MDLSGIIALALTQSQALDLTYFFLYTNPATLHHFTLLFNYVYQTNLSAKKAQTRKNAWI